VVGQRAGHGCARELQAAGKEVLAGGAGHRTRISMASGGKNAINCAIKTKFSLLSVGITF
jgi:hypothetical protein